MCGGGARRNAGDMFVEECSVASTAEFGNAGFADGEERQGAAGCFIL